MEEVNLSQLREEKEELARQISNMLNDFSDKYGVKCDVDVVFREIKSQSDNSVICNLYNTKIQVSL